MYFPRKAHLPVYVASLIYCAVVATMAIHSIVHHKYNADMLFYLGAAMSIQHPDPAIYHQMVYSTVQQHIPASQFRDLLSNKFLMAIYRDYHLFDKNMPFYTVKPLYIALIFALHSLGVDWTNVPTVISTFSFLLTAAICLVWTLTRTRGTGKSVWVLAAACVMGSAAMLRVIILSTPDALAMLLMTLFVVSFVERKLILSGVFSLLAILTRPDTIIFSTILLLICVLYAPKMQKRISGLFVLCGCLVHFTISHLAHAYSWGTLFEYTFYPEGFDPSTYTKFVTPALYWNTLSEQVWKFVANTSVPMYLFAAFLLIGLGIGRNVSMRTLWESRHSMYLTLLTVAAVSIVAHALLFPNADDRFYIYEYIAILLGAIGLLQRPSSSTS